jgi:hypothetical protein
MILPRFDWADFAGGMVNGRLNQVFSPVCH